MRKLIGNFDRYHGDNEKFTQALESLDAELQNFSKPRGLDLRLEVEHPDMYEHDPGLSRPITQIFLDIPDEHRGWYELIMAGHDERVAVGLVNQIDGGCIFHWSKRKTKIHQA